MKLKLIFILIIMIITSSCIKTAEQLEREKRIDTMTNQMGDTQGLVADLVSQVKTMQSQIDKLQGRLEEMEHQQKQLTTEQSSKSTENFNLLKTQQEEDRALLSQMQTELKEQRGFIEKVTLTLAQLKDGVTSNSSKNSKKKSDREELNRGLTLIKNNQHDEAKKILAPLIDSSELTLGDKNKMFHGLGKIEYFLGNHEKAMIYFTKIFTKFPKASLAPSSLLFIGRSLSKMGKKDEAKQAFLKLIEDYNGTKEANEAKKEI